MRRKQYNLLLHPFFLLSLLLLLLNDFYLKQRFHNEFTGKLSDVSGLFTFSIFLTAVTNYTKKSILLFVFVFFTWWKSPFSEPLIQLLNYYSIPVSRVSDFTDLWALAILPFIYLIRPAPYIKEKANHFALTASIVISFFAFCATSLPYRELYYYPNRINEISLKEVYYTSLNETEILNRFSAGKTDYKVDTVRYYRVSERFDLYYQIRNAVDSSLNWVPVKSQTDSTLYIKKTGQRFITLPLYILNGDSLFNLQLEIKSSALKKRPTMVTLESFQTHKPEYYSNYFYGPLKKSYTKHFKSLLRN